MVKRRFLSKSDIKKLNNDLAEQSIKFEFSKKDKLELVEDKYYVKDNECLLFIMDGKYIPTIRLLLKEEELLPIVVVDMGAIRFIANGADVMRPGILECSEFSSGSYVVVKDEKNRKPIIVGKCDLSSTELMAEKEGKLIQNIHYVGDDIWNFN